MNSVSSASRPQARALSATCSRADHLLLVAGGGAQPSGVATNCALIEPFAVDFANGHLYIAEMEGGERLLEVTPRGILSVLGGATGQKGDSGGPVYVPTDQGRAVIVGLFNSTWGNFPAAVSWQAANKQISEDVHTSTSATLPVPQPVPAANAVSETPG